jgi:hypothetical protein
VNISGLLPVAQFLGALSLPAIVAFYWSNVRLQARRVGVLDLATKQIAFWDQALKLELSATTDKDRQREAKDRAFAAVERIRSHADKELARLTWSESTNNLIFQSGRRSVLNLNPPSPLQRAKKFKWWSLKILAWLMLVSGLFIGFSVIWAMLVPPHRIFNAAEYLWESSFILATPLLGLRFGVAADRLALPMKPEVPLLEKI